MEKSISSFDRRYRTKRIIFTAIRYAVLIFFAVLFFIPFAFALSTSLTTPFGIYEKGYNWMWHEIDFSNYSRLFREYNILGGFANTLLYIIPPIVLGVFTSAMAGYAFARLKFPGRNVMFFVLLSCVVLPGIITLIPSYVLFASVYKWANTPLPIIVPGCFGSALTMFFIRQFFLTLPRELEDAAMLDGLNWWGIFIRIALPLATPVLITQLILSFNGAYNDYLGPLLYVGTVDRYKTLQLILATVSTVHNKQYTLMMAGAIVALLPTFILYLFAQKTFVEGIVMTGIKG